MLKKFVPRLLFLLFGHRSFHLIDLIKRVLGDRSPKSVYFFTLHKCASSLFSSYVLKNVKVLTHVDYEMRLYNTGKIESLIFRRWGCIYGPIRLSKHPEGSEFSHALDAAKHSDFLRDKTAILLIRDPRDILVSQYYSFGFSHGASAVQRFRECQEATRNTIRNMTIDEYAINFAEETLFGFKELERIAKTCEQSEILKYEDMIDNWTVFSDGLSQQLQFDRAVLEEVYKETRPKQVIDQDSHRRSGKIGQFRVEFKSDTINQLNEIFQEVLVNFQYPE